MGNLLIFTSLFITFILFLLSKTNITNTEGVYTLIAQITGLFGAMLISWNFILATRLTFIEKLFNGIDRVYKTHNIIGNIAFTVIINHPLFLIIQNLPVNTSKLYLIPNVNNLPYLFGILALYTLIALIVLTIFINIEYKLWKKTHEFIGFVIIFGGIHSLLISSDVSNYPPLKFWILSWSLMALFAYIYKRFFYYFIFPINNYLVERVVKDNKYLVLDLVSSDPSKMLYFQAGQFAFFSLNNDVRNEHPFSILEEDGQRISIGVKITGKFTNALCNMRPGENINVHGPFGSFSENIDSHSKMLWISAGIGITPFFSMAKNLKPHQSVTMIHSTRSNESEIIVQMLHTYQDKFSNLKLIVHKTDVLGRLNENTIGGYYNLDKDTYVYICGPSEMMDYMQENLPKKGILKKRIIFEDFKLKP